jgi:hypothetical protein
MSIQLRASTFIIQTVRRNGAIAVVCWRRLRRNVEESIGVLERSTMINNR